MLRLERELLCRREQHAVDADVRERNVELPIKTI